MKRLTLNVWALACAAALAAFGPAAAQDLPPGHEPVPGHGEVALSLGFEPMMLEIGEGERLSLPRNYDQTPCDESVVRSIFSEDVDDDFIASLRCWAVPSARSGEFVQTLDQAVIGAGWTYVDAAGMGAHYRKGMKELDILVFGLDQFTDGESTDVGYLFGVVDDGEG